MNNQITVTICGDVMPVSMSVKLREELALAMLHEIRSVRCRRVTGRNLDDVLTEHARFDVGHEIVLPERAREDHR